MKPTHEPLAISRQELQALIARAQAGPLEEADCRTLQAVVDTLERLTQLLADKSITIARLRQMPFGFSTEKTENVLKRTTDRAVLHRTPTRRGKPQGRVAKTGGGTRPADSDV